MKSVKLSTAILIFLSVAILAYAAKGKFYAACSQEPGGGWCAHYDTYEAAKKAAEDHKKRTGHTDCSASSGKCPICLETGK